jgi:hypothetical protein
MRTALELDQILMFTDRFKGRAAFAANGMFFKTYNMLRERR